MPPAGPGDRRTRWIERAKRAAPAAIAGGLGFVVTAHLGIVDAIGLRRLFGLEDDWAIFFAMLAAGGLALTKRFRAVPYAVAGTMLAAHLLVAFTPLTTPAIRGWLERDEPAHADAIVVLSSDVTDDGHLSANGMTRLVAGLDLARAGWAPLLVRTDLSPPRPDETADVDALAHDVTVEIALVGPVASTRDEALLVARLAEERGLHRVIVVTSPLHERRAAAAFRAVGLDVVACPSPERMYSIPQLDTPGDRMQAFRTWVTELSAWAFYSLRGWV
jgi:uncharacterized SAM-binding protein YcdF (DUF218 family)